MKGISNAYRVALERHLGQAEPSQDLDENATCTSKTAKITNGDIARITLTVCQCAAE